MVPIVIGASLLHHALQTRDPQLQQKAETLPADVYSDTGICLHPLARNPMKSLQNIIQAFDYGQEFIVCHDVINNTIKQMCCEREGAPGIQSELKTLNIPVVNVVKELISNSKRKDSSQTNEYKQLHQHSLEIHSLEIVIKKRCRPQYTP